jgi:ribonuclease PH
MTARQSKISQKRRANQLRAVRIKRHFTAASPGSVLLEMGDTIVLCTASVEDQVPAWMQGSGRGWMTAEYNMLPHSTTPRKRRDRGKVDGRTTEIQRLIGRSLRAVADLDALGERTITIDCDVLQADGGTRTASITGALVAVVDALADVRSDLPDPSCYPLRDSVAAVSVGLLKGRCRLDLDYELDRAAEVDMNVVMTGAGQYVEIQGTGEEATFDASELDRLLTLARRGIGQLEAIQKQALGRAWPF